MPLVQTSAPSIEPVTLAEAKNHLRVDSDLTQDDALITMLISAARRYAESYCGLSFISQGWRLVLDAFPGAGVQGVPWGRTYSLPGNAVLLERGPVTAITSITYTAMDGSNQTMPSTDYAADVSGLLGRVTPVFGRIWPIPLPQIGAVKVDYTAGFGATAASVPEGIRQWMLLRTATLYRNREEVAILVRGKVDPLPYVDSLLDPYRVVML
jgi:uncharacterized phiE125 gp8 family phage protein